MPFTPSPPGQSNGHSVILEPEQLDGRTFLLGDGAGFVLYLPAAGNTRDRTLQGSKWFGASGFGRSFLETVTVRVGANQVLLSRENQSEFRMHLDSAERVFTVDGKTWCERFWVPNGQQTVVWTVEGQGAVVLRPEFNMRYYQAFNTDFSSYAAEVRPEGLSVSNHAVSTGSAQDGLDFYGLVAAVGGAVRIELLPAEERLVEKTYERDRHREEVIHGAYAETHDKFPDEAPIWNQYSTQVYIPACLYAEAPVTIVLCFGDTQDEVLSTYRHMSTDLPAMQGEKRERIEATVQRGGIETGDEEIDLAYTHVLTRFNDCLVARDATLHVEPVHRDHFYGIFAGNKYFMDAWKRDENISLGALLATGDHETVRAILDDTWQYQDDRTGRLPHIIRAGEPLVYYSSDGTLWALHRLLQYSRESGDSTLLEAKLPMVERFFTASLNFVQRGLVPSGGIVDPKYLWETWEDTPYTPRDGYPVEIELLWLTVLDGALDAMQAHNPSLAHQLQETAALGHDTFRRFTVDGYLADSLSYDWQPRLMLTPNGYVAFGLDFPLPPDLARSLVLLGRDQLAGRHGVRSLAPRDWPKVFPAAFLADPQYVQGKDMTSVGLFNYHRGIEWEWFNPFFVQGELACGSVAEAAGLYVEGQARGALRDAGIGGESELYARQGQMGADFQAWSMAALIESLHRFSGVRIDAGRRRVSVCPALPPNWPHLHTRHRMGNSHFEVLYGRVDTHGIRLEVRPQDGAVTGGTLDLGIRLESGLRIVRACLGGVKLPLERLRVERPAAADLPAFAWLEVPFAPVVLEVWTDLALS